MVLFFPPSPPPQKKKEISSTGKFLTGTAIPEK